MTSTSFPPPPTAVARATDGAPSTLVGARRILVAEDHPGMLHLIACALRRHGHDVLLAHDGLELMRWIHLLSRWADRVPLADLVVTDLRMPKFTGLECIEELRLVGNMTPVVLITAFGSDELHRQALSAGACAVLDKPLLLDELCDLVHRHLK